MSVTIEYTTYPTAAAMRRQRRRKVRERQRASIEEEEEEEWSCILARGWRRSGRGEDEGSKVSRWCILFRIYGGEIGMSMCVACVSVRLAK